MPPKSKAKAKAKATQKQKQSQVVNIKIGGETAKPKPKRKYTRKPKATGGSIRADALPDGWLPPVNITRSGQVFPPYQPAPPQSSYSSAPPVVSLPPEIMQRILRLEQTGSAGTGFAPPAPAPPLLMGGEPEMPPEPPTPSLFETPAPPPAVRVRKELPPATPKKLDLMGELKEKLIARERKKLEAPAPESFMVSPPPAPEVLAPLDIPPLEAVGGEEEEYVLEKPKKVPAPPVPTPNKTKKEIYNEIVGLFQELGIGQKTDAGKELIKSIIGVNYKPLLKDNEKGLLIQLRDGLRMKLQVENIF